MTYLPIWDAGDLAAMESLDGVLCQAHQDDRLRRPACLLVRSEATAARTVRVTHPGGQEWTWVISPARREPSVKHPLGHTPADTVIGPVEGHITYLPTARGLRVLAYEVTGKDHGDATT